MIVPNPMEEVKPAVELIPYYRVSTGKQFQSGLGLQAQRDAVAEYAKRVGGRIVAEFMETETRRKQSSGRRVDRPEMLKAIALAKRLGATLVIAKLDRLARNVHFISGLMETNVRFLALDHPDSKPFELHIYAAMAEEEARQISSRVTKALQAFREHQVIPNRIRKAYPNGMPEEVKEEAQAVAGKLGAQLPACRNLTNDDRRKGAIVGGLATREKAIRQFSEDITPLFKQLRAEGKSLSEIAAEANRLGYQTANRASWSHVQVRRVLERG